MSNMPIAGASSSLVPIFGSPLGTLEQRVNSFITFASAQTSDDELHFSETVAHMHALLASVRNCEKAGVPRLEILEVIGAARDVYACSPFMNHIQTWPRGYQGDFTIVDQLVRQKNLALPESVAYQIERYCLTTGLAQQHRNKVMRQAELIQHAVLEGAHDAGAGGARILLVACGGSPDVGQALPLISRFPFQLVLNDLDAGALEHSQNSLDAIRDRVTMVHGNALTSVHKLAKYGPYDLVLVGGLFDYLSDRHVHYFLDKACAKLLKPEGTLFFTNIARGNPYRAFVEYFGDWTLIERSEPDITRMCESLPLHLQIERDLTGLAWLVKARRISA